MRDHAIVSPHFWTGDTGRQLRKNPEAQRVAFYLMTCPSANMIGLYYLPIPLICHEVGISEEGALEGLRSLSEAGFCDYDHPSEVVFVKKMARYQLGDSLSPKDNRHLAVQKQLTQMRSCKFYNDFLALYGEVYCLTLTPTTSPLQAPSEPLRSKDKDKDKEKEKENTYTPQTPLFPEREEDEVSQEENGRILETAVLSPPVKPKTEYSAGFLRFWQAYPLKKAKDAAWAAWQRKKCEAITAEICASVVAHREHDDNWARGFTPYPATFLNAGSWKDELDEPQPTRHRGLVM